ncbi:D-alanyl-D-alanine carboxypeptidase [Candidatus Peregrinibacteria bacterium]|nr:D-alanyl-D-alanine carboxypeptidase [Candidatus Peregrinibacteria bacterium]
MLKTFLSLLLVSSLGVNTSFNENNINQNNSSQKTVKSKNWNTAILLEVAPYPKKRGTQEFPNIEARAAITVDVESGAILYEKNKNEKLPMASITKLILAVIIAEKENLSNTVVVSSEAAKIPGSKIWLNSGEKLLVRDLLKAILIHSANDAAYALAQYHARTEKTFVEQMNNKALFLGLKNTHFTNVVGFDQEGNYSTTQDLSLLAIYAYKNPIIREYASLGKTIITSQDGKVTHELIPTNQIIGGEFKIVGLKTGNTEQAGPSFISIALGPGTSHPVVSVILNSPNRFEETKKILKWTYDSFVW